MKNLIALSFLFFGLNSFATTYYVSPTGNDNTGDGSLSMPYQTPSKALVSANAGDIIELRQGTYNTTTEIRISQNNMTLRSYPGEKATLNCVTNIEDASACIWFNEPDVTGGLLENLEIIGGYYYGVKLESNWDWGLPASQRHGVSHVTIRNCNIHHTGRDCIKLTPGCNYTTIENCEIHHSGIGIANDPNDPNAEGIDNVNASYMRLRNSYIHHTSTSGVYTKGGAEYCMIEENLLTDIGEGGILLGFYTDSDWFNEVTNPTYYECRNSIARNNIIIGTGGAGIGFWGADHCEAYNNTVKTASPKYHTPLYFSQGEIWISNSLTAMPQNVNCIVRNNIFIDESPMEDDSYTIEVRENSLVNCVIDYNCYFNTTGQATFDDNIAYPALIFAQWQTQYGFDTHSIEGNPSLNSNMHQLSASICKDAGQNLNIAGFRDYDGGLRDNMPDMGADEFEVGANTSVPPSPGTIGTGVVGAITAAIAAADAQLAFACYPNPTTDKVFFSQTEGLCKVIDAKGILLFTQSISFTQNEVSLAHLPQGKYWIILENAGKRGIKGIVKE